MDITNGFKQSNRDIPAFGVLPQQGNPFSLFTENLGEQLLRQHQGSGTAILNAVTGSPIQMMDEEGNTASVSPYGMSINNPQGSGFSIGADGLSTTFNPANKTQITLKANPFNPGGHVGFKIGGRDPVKPFEGIQGLPEENPIDPETKAQKFLENYLNNFEKENPRYQLGVSF